MAERNDVWDYSGNGLDLGRSGGTPALKSPARDRVRAALDAALDTLEAVEAMAHEQHVLNYVHQRRQRIADILNG